ncbi:MAG: signal peptidase II [Deltaproteobacteria bacterium]|nr:signal peptidase II [Deltaproteobacteria bacterium]
MKFKTLLFIITVVGVIALDQVSKHWIQTDLEWRRSVTVIDGVFDLTHVRNTGVAFGLFSGSPNPMRTLAFAGISLIAMVVILLFFRKLGPEKRLWAVGLGLVFGGAWGNLIDRIRWGYVVDFLDFYWKGWHWPAFNIADASVTMGSILLLILILSEKAAPHAS